MVFSPAPMALSAQALETLGTFPESITPVTQPEVHGLFPSPYSHVLEQTCRWPSRASQESLGYPFMPCHCLPSLCPSGSLESTSGCRKPHLPSDTPAQSCLQPNGNVLERTVACSGRSHTDSRLVEP